MKHESESDTNCDWCIWKIPKRLMKGQEDLKIRGKVGIIQTSALLRSARIPRRVLLT